MTVRSGCDLMLSELRSHLSDLVPKWWLPDAMAVLPDLPYIATGKIQKLRLLEMSEAAEIEWDKSL